MSKVKKTQLLSLMVLILMTVVVHAAPEQIGSFQLPAGDYPAMTYFDPGFGPFATETVDGALVSIISEFSGVSSTADGTLDSTKDVGLRTYTDNLKIRQLCRYGSDTSPGHVQWKFDLTDLQTIADANNLQVKDLYLSFNLVKKDDYGQQFDIYLSYTNPAEGITLTEIDTTSDENTADIFYLPSQIAALGEVVNGTHKIIVKDHVGPTLDFTENITDLYNAGVRQFNVILNGDNYLQNRNTEVLDGSGLFAELGSGMAHTPVPSGPGVDPISSVSWYSPEQDSTGSASDDPNISSISGYYVWWSEGTEPNYVTDTPSYVTAPTQSYTPVGGINPETTYFWRVDTDLVDDNLNPLVVEGGQWSFTTRSLYSAPSISADNIITTLDLLPAVAEATVTLNSDPLNSPVLTLLTDDFQFPAGATASITDTTPDPSNPRAELMTDTEGIYKIKVEVSDTSGRPEGSLETIIVVNVADACQAAKDTGGWEANYFDVTGAEEPNVPDCIVNLLDFAVFAIEWLDETTLTEPVLGFDFDTFDISSFTVFVEAEDNYDTDDPNLLTDPPLNQWWGTSGLITKEDTSKSGGKWVANLRADYVCTYELDIPAAGDYTVYFANVTSEPQTVEFGTPDNPTLFGTLTTTEPLIPGDAVLDTATLTFTSAGLQQVTIKGTSGNNKAVDYDFIGLDQQ